LHGRAGGNAAAAATIETACFVLVAERVFMSNDRYERTGGVRVCEIKVK
jgi:hypothetical protein